MPSLGKKIVSGTIWTAALSWASQGANLIIFVLLAHFLGPEDFGLATLAMLPALISTIPLLNALPDALVQRADVDPLHLDSYFWFTFAIGLLISVTIWVCAGPIAAAFGQPLLVALIHWTGVIVVIQSLSIVPNGLLLRRLEFRLYALRNVVGISVGGVVGVWLAITGFGVWSLVWFQIVKAIVSTTLLLATAGWRPRLRYSHKHCNDLLSRAIPLSGFALISAVNDELPGVALGIFLGPQAVGIYAFARRPFSTLWDVFLQPLLSMVIPTVSRIQGEPERIDRFFNMTGRLIAIITLSVFVGFAAIAPVAVPFIFGVQWTSAVVAVQLISALTAVRVADALCSWTILALGHASLVLKLNVALTVLGSIPVTYAAQFSVEAMIIAILACYLVILPILCILTQRIAGVDVLKPLTIVPRLAVAAALMFVAVTIAQAQTAGFAPQSIVIACGIAVGAIVYAIAAVALVRSDLLAARDLFLKLRH